MADADWKKYRRIRGKDLPAILSLPGGEYRLVQAYKNDFYAATGEYEAVAGALPPRVVYKEYHADRWGPLPLGWLGRMLAQREIGYHRALAHVDGVPRLLHVMGPTSFVREHVPGVNLMEHLAAGQRPSAAFFPEYIRILEAIHAAGVCHNDLGKPENVLVRPNGMPVVIDFQIALRPSAWPLGIGRLAGPLVRYLRRVDRYHVRKNHRRYRPEDMTPELAAEGRRRGWFLQFHYYLLRAPYRKIRHFVLNRFLLAKSESAPRSDRKAA